MKPYYEHGGIQIYHGDCREVLPTLAQGAAEMLCTDPPFGIGFAGYASHDDDEKSYEDLLVPAIAECLRIIGDGPAFVWQGMKQANNWHRWFPNGYRILAACKGFVQFRPTPIQWSWDPIIHWGNAKCEVPSVYHKDYHVQQKAPFGAGREHIDHPCPRPLEQVKYFMGLSESASVLDPFMGSGTTLRAAKDLGRRAIGIEIEERYCEIAVNRLAQEVLDFAK